MMDCQPGWIAGYCCGSDKIAVIDKLDWRFADGFRGYGVELDFHKGNRLY